MVSWYKIYLLGRSCVDSRWSKDLTFLPVHRLYYIHDGEAKMRTRSGFVTLSRGAHYFLPAFSVLESRCESFLDHSFIHFSTSHDSQRALWNLDENEMVLCESECQKESSSPNVLHEMVRRNYDREDLSCQMRVRGAMDLLLSPFFRQSEKRLLNPLQNSVQYIEDHLGEELTLADLAREAGYAPNYYSELFHKVHGQPPVRYLQNRRIERAQLLLHTTNLPINEIAFQVGIPDARYFSRVFKMTTGQTPREYRIRQNRIVQDLRSNF